MEPNDFSWALGQVLQAAGDGGRWVMSTLKTIASAVALGFLVIGLFFASCVIAAWIRP